MTDETRAVVDRIRRNVKPEAVIAVAPDGSKTPLAIGQLKNRWSRLGALLDNTEWAALECYDHAGALIATIPADDDVEAAAATTSDPMASQLVVWTAHMDRVAMHIRGAGKEVTDSLLVALQTQITRNVELSEQIAALQSQLMEAYAAMRDMMLEKTAAGEQLSPKELAVVGVIDSLGQKFAGLPSGWSMPAQAKPALPGNGGTDG